MDEETGIESPTNKQKGTTPQVIAKAGNTWRIESAGMDIRAAWDTPTLSTFRAGLWRLWPRKT